MTEFNKIYTTTTGRYEVDTSRLGKAAETALDKLAAAGPIDQNAFAGIVAPYPGAYRLAPPTSGMPPPDRDNLQSPDLSSVEGDVQATLLMVAALAQQIENDQNRQRVGRRRERLVMEEEKKDKADAAAKKEHTSRTTKAAGDMAAGALNAAGGGIGVGMTAKSFKSSLASGKANDALIDHKIAEKTRLDHHEGLGSYLKKAEARQATARQKVDDLDQEVAGLRYDSLAAAGRNNSAPRGSQARAQARAEVDALDVQINTKQAEKARWEDNFAREGQNVSLVQARKTPLDESKGAMDRAGELRQIQLNKAASRPHESGERWLAGTRVITPVTQSISQGTTGVTSMDASSDQYDADLLKNEQALKQAQIDVASSQMQDYESGASSLGRSASDAVSAASSLSQSSADHAKAAANRF
ncbi:hypothetical protein [Caenimonas sp. SL110]|uniref:hypothetical protein n=1 Tax=Caenimonas sp. SL110 TaxID=1450524 RepID=UPI000652D93D|nr:hypothetical protein [Caenimonas sp. SL110]